MLQRSLAPMGMYSAWIKVIISIWIFLIVFVYLLLFGPPELWLFIERLGFLDTLQAWKSWLESFFTADYLS